MKKPMLKDEIEKVLEKLYRQAVRVDDYEKAKEKIISQALTHILELVEKCVPEEKTIPDGTGELWNKGYDQALAEIKQRIGGEK